MAADVLLPGDPKRAMELAAALMTKPLMSNLSRGLWGYTGRTADGRDLTVQATGIGGPSAAIVMAELAELGARRAIRVGTCVALDPKLAAGDSIVATGVVPGDGAANALEPSSGPLPPDESLTARLAGLIGAAHTAPIASTDLYYDDPPERRARFAASGAAAVDLSSGALFAVGRRSGVAVACALVVAETAGGERLGPDELDRAALELGELAGAALLESQAPVEGAPLS
jgi:uridine phosphorylase